MDYQESSQTIGLASYLLILSNFDAPLYLTNWCINNGFDKKGSLFAERKQVRLAMDFSRSILSKGSHPIICSNSDEIMIFVCIRHSVENQISGLLESLFGRCILRVKMFTHKSHNMHHV